MTCPVPLTVRGRRRFPFSQAHYNKVYRTAQFALGCVLTDMYNNMATWRLLRPIRRPTAAGGILAQAMRRLFYLIGEPRTHFDPNDEEEWDWLSLIYAMTGCIVLFCAGKVVLLCGTWSFKDYLVAATPSTRRETVDAAAKVPRFEGLVHSGLRR